MEEIELLFFLTIAETNPCPVIVHKISSFVKAKICIFRFLWY